MKILGIDPGTKCGWAILDDGKRIASGVFDLKPRRHEGGGMRFVRLERYLLEILNTYTVDLLAYELVRRHLGTDAAHVYGGIIASLTRLSEERALPYRGVPVGTCKKAFCGKGNASKSMMIKEAEVRFGIKCCDNEADALAVAWTLGEELGW